MGLPWVSVRFGGHSSLFVWTSIVFVNITVKDVNTLVSLCSFCGKDSVSLLFVSCG